VQTVYALKGEKLHALREDLEHERAEREEQQDMERDAHETVVDDNDDGADDGNFHDTVGEILGASSPSLDLDLAFGSVDSNVDLAPTFSLPLPLSPLPSPLLLLLLLLGSPSEIQEFSLS